jgi:hypothetical protein|tara:strand:+ start:972 stop:1187 length:216 start_codon:yes stop_codon:yes gene_type:complete
MFGHCDFDIATDEDWDRAEARELALENPDTAWICTNRGAWHFNPHYKGLPMPHPEQEWAGTLEEYRASLKS